MVEFDLIGCMFSVLLVAALGLSSAGIELNKYICFAEARNRILKVTV